MSAIHELYHEKSLQIFFISAELCIRYGQVKVGECTKGGDAKKKKKRKLQKFYRRQWQLTAT